MSLFLKMTVEPPGTRWADEAFFVYVLLVAGKRADTCAEKLSLMLGDVGEFRTLRQFFRDVARSPGLDSFLRARRTGQYDRLARALSDWAHPSGPDVASPALTVADLEAVHGCGPKSARFFFLYRRPDVRVAVIDTHILKFLVQAGVKLVPRSTPAKGVAYRRMELELLLRADALGMTPKALDDLIWRYHSRGESKVDYDRLFPTLRKKGLAT